MMHSDPFVMTPTHPHWSRFAQMLTEAIAEHDHCQRTYDNPIPLAHIVLTALAETEPLSVLGSLLYLERHGASCDCVLLMNVPEAFKSAQERAAL